MKNVLMYIAIWFSILLWGYNIIINIEISKYICHNTLFDMCFLGMLFNPIVHLFLSGAILIMFSKYRFCSIGDYQGLLLLSFLGIMSNLITLFIYSQ